MTKPRDTTRPPVPHTAEGDYLRERRELAGLTVAQACEGTSMKPDKWGDVERGRTHSATGRPAVEWHAPAPFVAIMAARLGVTPEQLRQVGRWDAAEIVEREAAGSSSTLPPPIAAPASVTAAHAQAIEAADALFDLLVSERERQGASPNDRATLEFLWRATDGNLNLKPIDERVRDVIGWVYGPGKLADVRAV